MNIKRSFGIVGVIVLTNAILQRATCFTNLSVNISRAPHLNSNNGKGPQQTPLKFESSPTEFDATLQLKIENWSNSNLSDIAKIYICNDQNVPHCLAFVWHVVGQFIDNRTSKSGKWTLDKSDDSFVIIALTDCNELKNYTTFSMFHACLDFTQDCTRYFGHRFHSMHFHPTQNCQAPFPIISLSTKELFDQTYISSYEESYEKELLLNNWLGRKRSDLTIIYNQPAASGMSGNFELGSHHNRLLCNDQEVIELSQRWIDFNKPCSNALRYPDVLDWYVSSECKVDHIYQEIWTCISTLYDKGLKRSHAESDNYELWLENVRYNRKSDHIVLTSMFISTKYCAHNSEGFKRFAITINAALKRITNQKMSLEIFHPEYMGRKGYNHSFRRSPYPMLQFCYTINNKDET